MVMRWLMATVLTVAWGWAAADSFVQVRPGMMWMADISAQDCATFNEMHYNGPAGMELNVLTWVQGYVHAQTGSNIDALLAAIPADNGWNFDTLTGVFVDYCRQQPEARVSDAAIRLAEMLAAGQPAP